MKTLVMTAIRRQVQRLGVGALVLALSTALTTPLPAVAKEKRATTVNVSKPSKQQAKPAKAKNTKQTKHNKSRTTQTAKTTHNVHKQQRAKPRNAKQSRKNPVTQAARQAEHTPSTRAADTRTGTVHQVGKASYYSAAFHGKRTASGERYDQNALTCAHGSLPFGCRIRVTNLSNRKSVEVKVNDRGAFHKHGRVIDLSKAAAQEIGMVSSGTAKVQIEVLE